MVEPLEDRRAYLAETYGVTCVADPSYIEEASLVVLAVKPQVMFSLLEELYDLEPLMSSLFVSIAAGLTTQRLEEALPPHTPLVRTMPNLPLLVGKGATAVCAGSDASADDVALVQGLFSCLGSAYVVSEEDMDAVCALSGSGPAYVAAFLEALEQAGREEGLSDSLARDLALQTVSGTARYLEQTGQAPKDLRRAVSSPGGTTLAALSAMEEAGYSHAIEDGVKAAVRRSKELAAC